ncbi:MAG: TolC family protein [Planctomycetia bacterium]|nr:TolC family protein [Planctomycetia bacterium]
MRILYRNVLTAALVALGLAGCRSNEAFRRTQANDFRSPARQSSASSATVAQAAATKSLSAIQLASAEVVVEAPIASPPNNEPQSLTLTQAIETGLAQNPDLITQRQTERVSEAALGVAETYPFNPFVQVQATPYQHSKEGGGGGTTYHYVLLMQQIQLAHQQQHREEGASAALNSTLWNILNAQLQNVVQTERLYFAALYQKGVRDLAQANADNNEHLLTILERQLKAGQATAADVSIVRLDVRSTRQQAQLLEANYQTALLDLKRQLNLPMSQPLELAEELTHWNWQAADPTHLASVMSADLAMRSESTDPHEVIASLAACRPDVLAARANLDAARANCHLADASRTPDLQVGPYYQRNDSGVTFVGFRAQMDLPVLNNGTPLLKQRSQELHQQTVVWQQLQTRAELEALAAVDRYERARRLIAETASNNGIELPIELQRLEAQFQAGEVDVLRIFQARTSLIQSRRAYLDTLNELAQSAATVTATTGVPPQALAQPRMK